MFVGLAFTIHHEAAVMPLLVGVPGLGLSLVQLVIEMRKVAANSDEPIFFPFERSTAIWLMGFVVGIIAFGFTIGAPLLVAAYLFFAVGQRWLAALIRGGLCSAIMYVLDRLLNIPLFEGLIIHYLFFVADVTLWRSAIDEWAGLPLHLTGWSLWRNGRRGRRNICRPQGTCSTTLTSSAV